MANTSLTQAGKAKKDEFYTQLSDIEKELKHYSEHFAGKTVLCNCDDPYESQFFRYFAMKFNELKLRKLICTCYDGSSLDGQFDFPECCDENGNRKPYKIVLTEVCDKNGDGAVDMQDVDLILQGKDKPTLLKGNGDFRSAECVELLQEADIVVTNPPFSLFREYVAQLVRYDKKYLIIGNVNAITYKEIFPLIMQNRMWLGESIHSGDRKFGVPNDYELHAAGCGIDEVGQRFIRVKGVRWFTNLDIAKRHEKLDLYKTYSPEKYPKYDNYDAINVDKVAEIPCDYAGAMGVPITFLDKYNPEQFEIVSSNEYRVNESIPYKSHGLIKDKEGTINGRITYVRLLIKNKSL